MGKFLFIVLLIMFHTLLSCNLPVLYFSKSLSYFFRMMIYSYIHELKHLKIISIICSFIYMVQRIPI